MIQFNLLPDVKIAYLKAAHIRRLVTAFSSLASIVMIVITVALFSLTELQKHNLSSMNSDISADNTRISANKDLPKILTIQNQLESLTALHDQKPDATLLAGYLSKTVPQSVYIDSLSVDFTQDTFSIGGVTDSLNTVNQFVDTLKFTTYNSSNGSSKTPAFSNVVLSNFSLSPAQGTDGSPVASQYQASYTITFNYDPEIFNIVDKVALNVPKDYVTTRSQVDQPTDLFVADPTGGNK